MLTKYHQITLQSIYTSWHPYHWLWVPFSPLTLDVSKLLIFCQFYDYEISSVYFHSLNTSKFGHLFICLLAIWISSVKFLLISSAYYSLWLFVFIIMICRSFLTRLLTDPFCIQKLCHALTVNSELEIHILGPFVEHQRLM